jgi:hypothetical protein
MNDYLSDIFLTISKCFGVKVSKTSKDDDTQIQELFRKAVLYHSYRKSEHFEIKEILCSIVLVDII